jgi:beta-lactamase regulating signal transducer with metallopeptidase domain
MTNPARAGVAEQAGPGIGLGYSTTELMLGIYLAGICAVFTWQLIGRAYAYRLRARAQKVSHRETLGRLERLRALLGIRRPVELLSTDLISIPFSAGYRRPVIVLPQEAFTWPGPVLESVMIHELAHIKRKDVLARVAGQLGCCIHWINPLAWYGLGQIMMEQEIACDNLVLAAGTKASDYARNLLVLARVRPGRMDFALTALGRRTELKNRLMEILKPTRNRLPLQAGGSVALLVFAVGMLLPVSALNLWKATSAGARLQSADEAGQNGESLAVPQPGADSQSPRSSAKSLPDVGKVKEELAQKIRQMKKQGVPEEEIAKFTTAAKAKIEDLQAEKMRQAGEKTKPVDKKNAKEAKKTG